MKNLKLRALCECGIFTAAALALSYLKIPIGLEFGGFGGSISLVMIPIVICAIRWGLGWGLGTGLVFGILKFFIGGGSALNWQSMLLDYFVAYMFVGFAGLIVRKSKLAWLSALVGCLGRFLVHFVSGITIYAIVEQTTILGVTTADPWLYSVLYNGSYMLPNTVLTVLCVGALALTPLSKYLRGDDLRR